PFSLAAFAAFAALRENPDRIPNRTPTPSSDHLHTPPTGNRRPTPQTGVASSRRALLARRRARRSRAVVAPRLPSLAEALPLLEGSLVLLRAEVLLARAHDVVEERVGDAPVRVLVRGQVVVVIPGQVLLGPIRVEVRALVDLV